MQMIYDGVAELVNEGEMEKAQEALEMVMDGEALAAHIASGGTAEGYIRQIFHNQGIA